MAAAAERVVGGGGGRARPGGVAGARPAAKSPRRAPACSFALEARRALFLECAHAFAVVVGQSGLALQVTLEIELRVEQVARRRVDRLLEQAIAPGRPVGEGGAERARFF